MTCSSCQTFSFRGDLFCRQCGAQLDPSAPSAEEPGVEAALRQAFTEMEEARELDALASARAALAIDPRSVAAHSAMSLIYERLGRWEEALHHVDTALELSPQNTVERERKRWILSHADRARREATRRVLIPVGAFALGSVFFGVVATVAVRSWVRGNAEPYAARAPLAPQTQVALGTSTPPPIRALAPTFGPNAGSRVLPSAPNRPGAPVLSTRVPDPSVRPMRMIPSAPLRAEAPTRIGLPPIVSQPPSRPSVGLPPATVHSVEPLNGSGVSMPGVAGGTGVNGAGSGTPKVSAPVEPFESDSGFIRIGPPQRRTPGAGGGATPPVPPIAVRIEGA